MREEPITDIIGRDGKSRRSQFEIPTEIDDVEAKERAGALYELALDAEAEGQLDTAIESLTEALDFYQSATYFNRLGLLHARRGDLEDGAGLIRRAVLAEPKNRVYKRNLEKISAMIRRSKTHRIVR